MSTDSLYGGYSTHPLPTRHAEKKDRDVPKYVQEKAEEIEAQGKPPEYAFPVAWSIYCKYKNPKSESCTMDTNEYFPNKNKRKASAKRVAGYYKRLLQEQEEQEGFDIDEHYEYTQKEDSMQRWQKAHTMLFTLATDAPLKSEEKSFISQAKKTLDSRRGTDPLVSLDSATRKRIRNLAYKTQRAWGAFYRHEQGNVPRLLKIKDEISRLFKEK